MTMTDGDQVRIILTKSNRKIYISY